MRFGSYEQEEDEDASKERQQYETVISTAYTDWFTYAANLIRKLHREQEFEDVLPVLDKAVSVRFVPTQEEADIMFQFTPLSAIENRYCAKGALGCYIGRQKDPAHVIYLPVDLDEWEVGRRPLSLLALATHEIGHSLSLSDQYDSAADKNSHAVYSSTKQGTGIMNNICQGKLSGCHLTCDDADGIINAIDKILLSRSERNTYGWHSLCRQSKDVYSYGKPVSRANIAIKTNQLDRGIEVRYYHEDGFTAEIFPWSTHKTLSPFQTIEESVVESDSQGRPLRTHGAQGEDIYYAYTYQGKMRLVTLNGEALLIESAFPKYLHKKGNTLKTVSHAFLFKTPEGKPASLESAYFKRQGGVIAYAESNLFDAIPNYLYKIEFDKHKKVTKETEEDPTLRFISDAKYARQSVPVAGSSVQHLTTETASRSLEEEISSQTERQRRHNLFKQMTQWFEQHYK